MKWLSYKLVTTGLVWLFALLAWICVVPASLHADVAKLPFFVHCVDCHANGSSEGGLDLSELKTDLSDAATFATWERIYDRVHDGEMPPTDSEQPSKLDRDKFEAMLHMRLSQAHAKSKGTVLRRLNRQEYSNTINELFGTNLDLADMLPEDSRSHEFDNVGESLGLSMVHLQRYMDAIKLVMDTSIAKKVAAPQVQTITAGYADAREAEKFVGNAWKKLSDNAIVRFEGGGYPSGMIRGSSIRTPGRYRVKVTGYAHQSNDPIAFSVGGTTFINGAEKPIYGYWSFPPGQPGKNHSIEFETWIEERYMIAIEPYGISDPDRRRRKHVNEHKGPGLAIVNVELTGPLVDAWPLPGHRLLFDGLNRTEKEPRNPADKKKKWYKPSFEIVSDNEQSAVQKILTRVAEAAFCRPVKREDVEPFEKLFANQRSDNASIEESLRTAVTAIFCSPNFLYFQEAAGKLDSYSLAKRLSYFLTRTAPDKQLIAAARSGELVTDQGLRKETERLMKSERFDRFLVDFSDSWLGLRDIDFTLPDRKLFPEFDDYLRFSMPLETHSYLHELIRSNLSVSHLAKSDFAMLNSRLAEHYGLPPVRGADVRKVALPENSLRGGFLSQASILKITANGTNTSPVTRGVWVMERILGTPPAPPPPGIPGVEPDIRGASTLRELLDKHRSMDACNSCHKKIDPPGFALETFNPIGGFRDRYRSIGDGDRVDTMVRGRRVSYKLGPNVDSSGQWGKSEFTEFRQFRDMLAANKTRLAQTFAEKIATFATGRELGFSDRAVVKQIVSKSEQQGFGVRDLIHNVVQSELFRHK